MGYLEPLSDVAQLESLIDGLNRAARVHSFPGEIRKLRTKFLKRRAMLVGDKSTVLAKFSGQLSVDDACVRLYDEAFTEDSFNADVGTQRQGKVIFAKLAADGGVDAELRLLRGPLVLDAASMRRLGDSSSEYVLVCPSGKVVFAGSSPDRSILLAVPANARVVASIHRIGENKMLALVAETSRVLPNDVSEIEQLEF